MKVVYCSECGTALVVTRKAIKSLGRIIDIIDPHECSEEPADLNLDPMPTPSAEDGKFVQNLNKLNVPSIKDTRPNDQVKSSAPSNLLEQVKGFQNSRPENDPDEL